MRKIALALAAAAALSIGAPAQAVVAQPPDSVVTYAISGTDVTGSFQLFYALTIHPDNPWILTDLNITAATLTFGLADAGLVDHGTYLTIGGLNCGGADSISAGCESKDFLLLFDTQAGVPQANDFYYHFAAQSVVDYNMHLASVTIRNANDTSGGVPEPSTWAMMLLGFGAIGFAMRRHNAAPRARRTTQSDAST